MSSDERLALRAAAGDERAFEGIYRRYNQDLYRFCLAMVGNTADAQDAVQNTMIKVLRALPGEKRQIKLKPWLYRIARNESIEILRRRREGVELEPQQAAIVSVTEAVEARERLRTLIADLAKLPERQRAVLVMRELAGLDFDQIGLSFATSAAAARQTLYEARLSLRQLEAGREMRCAEVMRELSDADGRVTRGREIRAHLDSCADCRAFRDEISTRREDLAGLAPMPLAVSAGLIHAALGEAGGGSVGAAGGATGVVGGGIGKIAATSAIFKVAASVAVVAVVGVSTDRSGLVDLTPSIDRHSGVRNAAKLEAPGRVRQPEESGRSRFGNDAAPGDGGVAHRHAPASNPVEEFDSRQRGRETDDESPAASEKPTSAHSPSGSQPGSNPRGGGLGRTASDAETHRQQPPPAQGEKGEALHRGEHPPSQAGPSEPQAGSGRPPEAETPASPPKADPQSGSPEVPGPAGAADNTPEPEPGRPPDAQPHGPAG